MLRISNKNLYKSCCEIGAYEGKNRVEHIASIDKEGKCEPYSVCWKISSGPVLNSETVARWVYTPPHVQKPLPGELCDTFFEDVTSNGLSVQRIYNRWEISRKDIHHKGQKSVENDGQPNASGVVRACRKYLGVIHFSADEMREAYVKVQDDEGKLRIYDTAIKGNVAHAEAMLMNQGQTRKIRTMLNQQMRTKLMVMANQSGIYKSPYIDCSDTDLLALKLNVKDSSFTLEN